MADAEGDDSTNLGNYPLKDIPNPHPHDVLCGRGGGSNSWIGSVLDQQIVVFGYIVNYRSLSAMGA